MSGVLLTILWKLGFCSRKNAPKLKSIPFRSKHAASDKFSEPTTKRNLLTWQEKNLSKIETAAEE